MKQPEGENIDPQEIFSKMFGGGVYYMTVYEISTLTVAEAFYDYVSREALGSAVAKFPDWRDRTCQR